MTRVIYKIRKRLMDDYNLFTEVDRDRYIDLVNTFMQIADEELATVQHKPTFTSYWNSLIDKLKFN